MFTWQMKSSILQYYIEPSPIDPGEQKLAPALFPVPFKHTQYCSKFITSIF
jgi:hypothetical protein